MAHKFDVRSAGILDSPDRKRFLNPDNIFDEIGLGRETVLADLGCGTGYFAIPASFRIKKVFALDIRQEMLEILRDKIKKEKISNIEPVLSHESSIPLPDNSIDVLFMANVFHEIEDRESILKEGKRILKSNGRLTIIDWKKVEMDFGPPVEERLDEDDVISICKNNDFDLSEQKHAGPYNYLLIFHKAVPCKAKKLQQSGC
jgi:ubiquinone/menaquinone biosynthesis C-methylase UbiE